MNSFTQLADAFQSLSVNIIFVLQLLKNEMIRIALFEHLLNRIGVFLFGLFFLFVQHVFGQDNVVYGERSADLNLEAVFLDQDGSIYPDYFISNVSLLQSNAKLHQWYNDHPSDFLVIAKSHNCSVDFVSSTTIQQLEDTLLAQSIRKIQSMKSNTNTLNVLVHGYRKSFVKNEQDVTSTEAFSDLERKMTAGLGVEHPTVKVYWDASYACCYSLNGKKNRAMFVGFERAYNRADTIGVTVKKLLNHLDYAQLNIVGHSLAAKVMQSCLYDLNGNGMPCLSQTRVNVCLIAPATTGIESWINYKRRNYLIPAEDNVRIWILYNENDFALKKKDNQTKLIGPGARAYGSTTLGCNHRHELDKFEVYVQEHFVGSTFVFVDGTALGKVHSQRFYVDSPYFKDMLDFLR
jgi:hypothetical protein